ncbi:hypothetical protein KBD34_01980 [Patescibacteria group bacterium]|nr:hypothetical protein [Patescibacteria group bacterium]
MKDSACKAQFMELRAQGMSFSHISKEINVSKPTLIEWSHELAEPIQNLRAIHEESLRERYRVTKEHELATLSRQLEAVEKELGQRTLADVPTDKLYGILFRLIGEARGELKPLTLQRTHHGFDLSDPMSKITWAA